MLSLIRLHLPPDNELASSLREIHQFFEVGNHQFVDVHDFCGRCTRIFEGNELECPHCHIRRYKGQSQTPLNFFVTFNMEAELQTRFNGLTFCRHGVTRGKFKFLNLLQIQNFSKPYLTGSTESRKMMMPSRISMTGQFTKASRVWKMTFSQSL